MRVKCKEVVHEVKKSLDVHMTYRIDMNEESLEYEL